MTSGTCRKLAGQLQSMDPPPGKIINMLWAAEALIIMTWLPDVFGDQPQEREIEPLPFTGNLRNMEHIAASSAAIQNVLIGATQKDSQIIGPPEGFYVRRFKSANYSAFR